MPKDGKTPLLLEEVVKESKMIQEEIQYLLNQVLCVQVSSACLCYFYRGKCNIIDRIIISLGIPSFLKY
jgi:hypothetical protein